jgi:hypothetical protein
MQVFAAQVLRRPSCNAEDGYVGMSIRVQHDTICGRDTVEVEQSLLGLATFRAPKGLQEARGEQGDSSPP